MAGGTEGVSGIVLEPLTLEEVQARIDGVPFSVFMGLRARSIEAERVVLEMKPRSEQLGNPEVGALHGGVLASLIDVSCSYAIIVPTRRSVVTVDLRVDYHRPAFGDHFTVEARPVNRGRTLSVAQAEIRNGEGKLIASGRAVLMQPKI